MELHEAFKELRSTRAGTCLLGCAWAVGALETCPVAARPTHHLVGIHHRQEQRFGGESGTPSARE